MQRIVTPELLDRLPPSDPLAIVSRRDLRRINAAMGQAALMARQLKRLKPRPRLIIDLGSGDGRFLLAVARRLNWPGTKATIIDLHHIVSDDTRASFARLEWQIECRAGDVFSVLAQTSEPDAVITANLFLHHFGNPDLARLLMLCAKQAGTIVACEPRRAPLALLAARLVWLLGANSVTLHDAAASVCAGFRDGDLSALWPARVCREGFAFPFSHVFVAGRDAI